MGPEHYYTLLPDFHFHWHKESLTTQVLHEQIKYCFIEIFFFIHTARVNYGNNKMCINKSEDRILHYNVATVSRYVIGGCTYK